MSKPPRTMTRSRIAEYVQQFPSVHGYAPSLLDIRVGMKLNAADTARYHLNILRDEGCIIWDGGLYSRIEWKRIATEAQP